ncbi:hypothetical protein H5P28_12160 [Ruficoccus amylovorans]|uniref:Flagellar hook-length control protein FliK n=1 Tax=Ruficoccus amylovorans TaxID=1804625 RepID=A0A842HF11_9BACT|nr:hypothetical protein [Ruficoccus amylovorans]MBC2595012.1 hypothetical protein [Ruficoccus amylovorans]
MNPLNSTGPVPDRPGPAGGNPGRAPDKDAPADDFEHFLNQEKRDRKQPEIFADGCASWLTNIQVGFLKCLGSGGYGYVMAGAKYPAMPPDEQFFQPGTPEMASAASRRDADTPVRGSQDEGASSATGSKSPGGKKMQAPADSSAAPRSTPAVRSDEPAQNVSGGAARASTGVNISPAWSIRQPSPKAVTSGSLSPRNAAARISASQSSSLKNSGSSPTATTSASMLQARSVDSAGAETAAAVEPLRAVVSPAEGRAGRPVTDASSLLRQQMVIAPLLDHADRLRKLGQNRAELDLSSLDGGQGRVTLTLRRNVLHAVFSETSPALESAFRRGWQELEDKLSTSGLSVRSPVFH